MKELLKSIPFWMKGKEIVKICSAGLNIWDDFKESLLHVRNQSHLDLCELKALDLHAWARGVKRLPGEQDESYRKRVRFAKEFRHNAGQFDGMQQLIKDLGAENAKIYERHPEFNWDEIFIELNPEKQELSFELWQQIIREYGRTCRRYVFGHRHEAVSHFMTGSLEERQDIGVVEMPLEKEDRHSLSGYIFTPSIEEQQQVGSIVWDGIIEEKSTATSFYNNGSVESIEQINSYESEE